MAYFFIKKNSLKIHTRFFPRKNLENNKRFTPTVEEVEHAKRLIENNLDGNKDLKALNEYVIQFFGYINTDGERIIWANYICKEGVYKDWQKERMMILDGGNCYFNVSVNMSTSEVFDLRIHGEA